MSVAEQASFFARWGEDIQSVISTGFQCIEITLNRVLFFQESTDALAHLTLSFELDRKYSAEEISHFRLFCSMYLKEPKHKILSILFGSSDKSNRMRNDLNTNFNEQSPGIKYGIGGGQWEQYIDIDEARTRESYDDKEEKYECVGSSSRIGMDEVEFLSISYSKGGYIRFFPTLTLRDLDEAMFLPFTNKSLAEKIKAIHVYSNGYKLKEISKSDFNIDESTVEPTFPVTFSDEELNDPWVSIRPEIASTFHIKFFEETPKRMFVTSQTMNSLENRNK